MNLTLSYLRLANYQEGECISVARNSDKSGLNRISCRDWSMKKRSKLVTALLFACLGIFMTAALVEPATAQAPAATPASPADKAAALSPSTSLPKPADHH
jgi:hypothetical protein